MKRRPTACVHSRPCWFGDTATLEYVKAHPLKCWITQRSILQSEKFLVPGSDFLLNIMTNICIFQAPVHRLFCQCHTFAILFCIPSKYLKIQDVNISRWLVLRHMVSWKNAEDGDYYERIIYLPSVPSTSWKRDSTLSNYSVSLTVHWQDFFSHTW